MAQGWVCVRQHAAQVGCVEEGARTGSRMAQLLSISGLKVPFLARLLRPRGEQALPLGIPYPMWPVGRWP